MLRNTLQIATDGCKMLQANNQRHWNRKSLSRWSWNLSANRRPKYLNNWIVDFPMALGVSTAADWKMKCRPNTTYLTSFLTWAASASTAHISCEDAKVLALSVSDETAAAGLRVHCYSIRSIPSLRSRSDGSNMDGIPSAERPCWTTSLRTE